MKRIFRSRGNPQRARAGGQPTPPARFALTQPDQSTPKTAPARARNPGNRSGTLPANSLRSHRLRGEQASRLRSAARHCPGQLRRSWRPVPSPTSHMSPVATRAGRNRGRASLDRASLRSGGVFVVRAHDPASKPAGLARRKRCTSEDTASAPHLLTAASMTSGDGRHSHRQRSARRRPPAGEHAGRHVDRRGALVEVARLRSTRRLLARQIGSRSMRAG